MEKCNWESLAIVIVTLFTVNISAYSIDNGQDNPTNIKYDGRVTIEGDEHILEPGQYYELNCSILNVISPDIHWILGDNINNVITRDLLTQHWEGHTLTDSKKLAVQIKSKYIIDCASKKHEGTYSCVAISKSGTAYVGTTKVTVNSDAPTEQCNDHKAPIITEYISTLLSEMGSNITLYCDTNSDSEITWKVNSDATEPCHSNNKRCNIDGNILTINSIDWLDMGDYECTVKSEYGEDSAATFLYPAAPGK